jgi:hypothetical protein
MGYEGENAVLVLYVSVFHDFQGIVVCQCCKGTLVSRVNSSLEWAVSSRASGLIGMSLLDMPIGDLGRHGVSSDSVLC